MTLIQGIWVGVAHDDNPATQYRRTNWTISEAEHALALLRGYHPVVPDVIVMYRNDHMVREWRKGQDYGLEW
jgi:hypothetical protein